MNPGEETKAAGEPAVGCGKPPVHTRFRKGQSGNPGGRPRGMTRGRAMALALDEAYRLVTVREGDETHRMPALQAVLRSQVALAVKGNGAAQRALIDTVRDIEREIDAQAARERPADEPPALSNLEAAKRVAFLLAKAAHEKGAA